SAGWKPAIQQIWKSALRRGRHAKQVRVSRRTSKKRTRRPRKRSLRCSAKRSNESSLRSREKAIRRIGIAHRLSDKTVKNHLNNTLDKPRLPRCAPTIALLVE